jgi:Right handed beta helix region
MNIKPLIIVNITLFAFLSSIVPSSAQGSLTPSSGPAPIMKSLDQIETRTPISSAGYGIYLPGSYYLTTNIVGFSSASAINVICDNVTIDFNGYTLQGVGGTASGISIPGANSNITIKNGIITGFGGNGISGGLQSQNVIVQHMIVSGNTNNGIQGNSLTVTDCTIQNNQFCGISVVGNGGKVTGNTLTGNNAANHQNGAGILIEGSNNLIADNFITGTAAMGPNGIAVFGGTSSNVIIKNCVIGWGNADYSIAEFNDVGSINPVVNSTNAWGNIAE